MSCIKIKCYIVSIDTNSKAKIEINDNDSLIKMNNLIKKLKKNKTGGLPIDKECDNRFFIKINDKTKFQFNNINYDNLSDLYGLEVFITFYHRYYNFKTSICDENNEQKNIFLKGYSFIAMKVNNINIFN